MFKSCGGDGFNADSDLHAADELTFEIRYVDAAQAASWACERGFVINQEDLPPTVLTYFD
jgi:hypothetical protein